MSTMPLYEGLRTNETLTLMSEDLLQLENNMVIRFGSSATILKLITVRGILQVLILAGADLGFCERGVPDQLGFQVYEMGWSTRPLVILAF